MPDLELAKRFTIINKEREGFRKQAILLFRKKQRKPKCYSLWPGMQSDAGVGSRTKPESDTGRLWGKRENVGPLSLKTGKLFTGQSLRRVAQEAWCSPLTLVELQ